MFSPSSLANTALHRGRWRKWATYTAVLLMALYTCAPRIVECLTHWNDDRSPSWVGALPGKSIAGEKVCDIDTRLIHGGLVAAPHLRDTTRWLTGTWAGQVPFYRPLTSYVFWFQWRYWGNFEARYHLIAVALHLLATLALARLARHLFVRYRIPLPELGILFMAALWVDGLGILLSQPSITGETLGLWKNQPDSLTLLFFSLCLTAYLQQALAPERGKWQTLAPAFWYVLLCLTKEAGIFLPLLLPIIEAPALLSPSTRRAAFLRLLPLCTLLPLYFGLRGWFLHDLVGYRYGSNDAWTFRLGSNVASGFSQALFSGDALIVGVAILFCGWVGYIRWLSRSGALSGINHLGPLKLLRLAAVPPVAFLVVSLGVAWQQMPLSGTFDVVAAVGELFLPPPIFYGTAAAVFLLCAARALRQRPVFGLMCYAWALMTLALTLFSPSVLHRYYLMNAAFAVLVAGGAMLWVAPLVERVRQRVQQSEPRPGVKTEDGIRDN